MSLLLDNLTMKSVRGINLEDVVLEDIVTPAKISTSIVGTEDAFNYTFSTILGYPLMYCVIPTWATYAEIEIFWDNLVANNTFLAFEVQWYDNNQGHIARVQNYYEFTNTSGSTSTRFLPSNSLKVLVPTTALDLSIWFVNDAPDSRNFSTSIYYKVTFYN